MPTSIVFAVVAAVFLLLAAVRVVRDGGLVGASRIWLLVGGIFALVAAWLFARR